MHVCVLVVGDVGRSPRMCYHALSLAQHGCTVHLVGYHNSKLPLQLLQHDAIRLIIALLLSTLFSMKLHVGMILAASFSHLIYGLK